MRGVRRRPVVLFQCSAETEIRETTVTFVSYPRGRGEGREREMGVNAKH